MGNGKKVVMGGSTLAAKSAPNRRLPDILPDCPTYFPSARHTARQTAPGVFIDVLTVGVD